MQRTLPKTEQEYKEYFSLLVSKGNKWDTEQCFHQAMQNPINGVITFKGIHRSYLHNGNLGCLVNYFSENGEHLFNKKVNEIIISFTQLTGYNSGFTDQMPTGVPYLVDLINKNPNVRYLDLSYTGLGDKEALDLLKALENNTKLEMLKLNGNYISENYLKEIEKKLVAKSSLGEIRKNAILLKQASLQKYTTLFSKLPDEINIKIASHTASPLSHNESESLKIAAQNYRKL